MKVLKSNGKLYLKLICFCIIPMSIFSIGLITTSCNSSNENSTRSITLTSGKTYEITGFDQNFANTLCNGNSNTDLINFPTTEGELQINRIAITGISFKNDESLITIGDNFLYNFSSFNQPLLLPNSLILIGNNFMGECTRFNHPLTLPNSITAIGSYFLLNCTSFNKRLTLSNSIISIDRNFLSYCESFNQTLTLPNTLTSINSQFLHYCTRFNQPLLIPSSITSIGGDFIASCTAFNNFIYCPGNSSRPDGWSTSGSFLYCRNPNAWDHENVKWDQLPS
ncbi:MAG: hypothetical protein Ta2E_03150 [Mycoplasmoidaceae bacterium]|nr:MAG: hypothetical protein Ta2E_03150 [Mycoplasmoidaceae bacterium]